MLTYIKNVKLAITFFPQLTGIDKIYFRFPEKISHKKHLFSALSEFFPAKNWFLLDYLLSHSQHHTTDMGGTCYFVDWSRVRVGLFTFKPGRLCYTQVKPCFFWHIFHPMITQWVKDAKKTRRVISQTTPNDTLLQIWGTAGNAAE